MAVLCMGCMETMKDSDRVCEKCGYVRGTPPKEAYHMAPESILAGRYIVGKVLGFGGFGVTYIGYDALLEQKIAIKEYFPGEFSTRIPGQTKVTVFEGEKNEQFETGVEKFLDEARRLSKLQAEQGVVKIYNSFRENNTAYLIMEYLEGESLRDRLAREGTISVIDAIDIVHKLIPALTRVHEMGIIHRDIAPDNLYLTKDGKVKLLDFGAARFATTSYSKSLSVIVKTGYAPPEQYRSRGEQGTWTDVYALAATFYRMITGMVPEDSMERCANDTLKPPSKLGVKLPKNQETALMNALNLSIEIRTKTPKEWEEELLSVKEVPRRTEKKKKIDIGNWPVGVKIGLGAAAIAAIGFAGILSTGKMDFHIEKPNEVTLAKGETRMPELINYNIADVEQLANEAGIKFQIVDKLSSAAVGKDKILSQSINSGEIVQKDSMVDLIVSAGEEKEEVPSVEGILQALGKTKLEEKGFLVETTQENSAMVPDYIIRQDKEADEKVPAGSAILLTISKGMEDIDETADARVPSLKNITFDEAMERIRESKLYIFTKEKKFSSKVPKGKIISQSVKENETAKQGTNIGVVLSKGVEMSAVPDVQYKTLEKATRMLKDKKLKISVEYEYNSTVQSGKIIRQSVKADKKVPVKTEVVVYVSRGPRPVTPSRPSSGGGGGGGSSTKKKKTKNLDEDSVIVIEE